MTPPPVVLSVAGSDPSGGAGIQADLKTFSALGAYGCAVVTALTAQNTRGVRASAAVDPQMVVAQLDALADDVRIDAVKVGMLATAPVASAVGAWLVRQRPPAVVLDPVMVATSGDRLLADDAVEALRALLPAVSLVTPNLAEAAVLLGTDPATSTDQMLEQAAALCARGVPRALVKGGHLDGDAVDAYAGPEGVELFASARVHTRNTHGTGCTLSSAIAALVARHGDWQAAVEGAKAYLQGALAAADGLAVGHGHGPVHHFHQLW